MQQDLSDFGHLWDAAAGEKQGVAGQTQRQQAQQQLANALQDASQDGLRTPQADQAPAFLLQIVALPAQFGLDNWR